MTTLTTTPLAPLLNRLLKDADETSPSESPAFADLLHPPLTTVMQPWEEMGAVATRMLLNLLNEGSAAEDSPCKVVLPTKLVVRESTAPPNISPLSGSS